MFLPIARTVPLAGRLTARFGPRPVMVAGEVVSGAGELCLLLVARHSGWDAYQRRDM